MKSKSCIFVVILICLAVLFSCNGSNSTGRKAKRKGDVAPVGMSSQTLSKKSNIKVFLQIGHKGDIMDVAISHDGKYFATGSQDKTIKLWDLNSGRLMSTLCGHDDFVISLAFGPDGKHLASGGKDSTIILWDIVSGKLISTFRGHNCTVKCLAFSPNGKILVSGSCDQRIKIWNVNSGKLLSSLDNHSHCNSISISPDGKRIVTGSDEKVNIWDTFSGRLVSSLNENPKDVVAKISKPSYSRYNDIESVAFSPDGRFVISASFEGTIKVWDIFTGRIVSVFKAEYGIQSLSCSPDGRYLLCGGYNDDNSLCLYRLTSGELVQSYRGHSDNVFFAAFSPDGNKILSGGGDNFVKLWNAASGGCISSFQAKSPLLRYNAVVFSKDAKCIFTQSNDLSRCAVFDISSENSTFLDCTDLNVPHSVDFNPAGNFLISAGGTFNAGSVKGPDFTVRLVDAITGKLVGKFAGHSRFVLSAKFSPDGKRVAAGGQDKTLILWEVVSRNIINTFKGHSEAIHDIAFSPDGNIVASSSSDGTIKFWDTDSGKMIFSLEGQSLGEYPFCCTFSPDGKRVLSAWNDDTFKIWDVVSGKIGQVIRAKTGEVYSVSFSPDAKFFLSGGKDKKVVIWRADSGEKLYTFKGHSETVSSVDFSSDGKNLISASPEGVVRVMARESGEKICEIFSFDDGEAVALTPDGFYSASPKGEKYITLRKNGMEVEEIAKYRNKFHRPDLVAQAVTGIPGIKPRYVALSKSIRKSSRILPSYLSFSGIKFSTQNEDQYLDSGENGMIEITIENQGKGASSPANLVLETPFGKKTVSVEVIEPKSSAKKDITFDVPITVKDGQATLTVRLEAGKYSPPPKKIKVRTVAAVPPSFDIQFKIDDDAVGESMGNGNGRIEPREKVALVADISNRGRGSARDVFLELSLSGGEIHRGSCRIGNLPPGCREQGEFLFLVPAGFEKDEIEATVTVREAIGIFDTTLKPFTLAVHKTSGEIIDFAGSAPIDSRIRKPTAFGVGSHCALCGRNCSSTGFRLRQTISEPLPRRFWGVGLRIHGRHVLRGKRPGAYEACGAVLSGSAIGTYHGSPEPEPGNSIEGASGLGFSIGQKYLAQRHQDTETALWFHR